MASRTNKYPDHVTDALWWLWYKLDELEPANMLGGIYADKPGYHNKRKNLPSTDYSVQLAEDKLGPDWAAAALDWTFPDAQAGDYRKIAKYSKRLLDSGRDLSDLRGNYLREFYGNSDLDTDVEGWDFHYLKVVRSDDSHLWHIHISIKRKYLADFKAMRAILSILKGETYAQWLAAEKALAEPPPPPPAPEPAPAPLPVTIEDVRRVVREELGKVTYTTTSSISP